MLSSQTFGKIIYVTLRVFSHCLAGDIVTLDDASFTTNVTVNSGAKHPGALWLHGAP